MKFLARTLLLTATTAAALVVTPFTGAASTAVTTGVVEIRTQYASSTGGGGAATGFVITSSGRVLTNNHVIRGASRIRVTVPGGRTYPAQVLGYSVRADVALLQLTGAAGLDRVVLGNSSTVEVGDAVTAVGNAGGSGLTTKEGQIIDRGVTIPLSDGQGGRTRLTRLLETSADLRQGDSGGPLLDDAGRVIGVNAAASVNRSGDSDGYAIPINRATAIVRQIDTGRTTSTIHVGPTPFLGVVPGAPNAFGESVAQGVPIAGVRAGSPAARAGIERGDVIVSLNGNAVRSSSELVSRLLRWHPGDRVRVAWIDAFAQRKSATVTLASGPPQ